MGQSKFMIAVHVNTLPYSVLSQMVNYKFYLEFRTNQFHP